jgi:pimeloyl-ACP methyl ester carboxylesterase
LHYVEQGAGDPVLLLHGWPTSAYLWRNVMPAIAERNRAVAIDLPGFGRSAKPVDASYGFRFYERVLSAFCGELGVERTGLAVHDLGGPVGLHWASRDPGRVTKLALLNTLVYARPSWAVIAFVAAARTPGVRSWLTSPRGLAWAMRFGVHYKERLSEETIRAYQEPFASADDRKALRRAGTRLHPRGFKEIEAWLPRVEVPVRIVYGARDRILPDVERTMAKVARDVPGAVETTVLADCGHFLQEDRPDLVGAALAGFFGS